MISLLVHGQVDGIKFETLDVLCRTYQITLPELLAYQNPSPVTASEPKWYRQEAELMPFTCWSWFIAMHLRPSPEIDNQPCEAHLYCLQEQGYIYFDYAPFNHYAEEIYRVYHEVRARKQLYSTYQTHAAALERLYRDTRPEQVLAYDALALKAWYERLWNLYQNFWRPGLFIDCFDAGCDERLIRSIVDKHHLSPQEVAVLTTPAEMTFHQERLLMLTGIAKRWARRRDAKSAQALRTFVDTDPEVELYRRTFDYAHSNYAVIRHITADEVCSDLLERTQRKTTLAKEYADLVKYSANRREQVAKVLRRHHLATNPLQFFQDLTFWREHRKKINLMGFHLLDLVLQWLEQNSGIARLYLGYLCYDEIDAVLKGSLTQDILKHRREQGVLFTSLPSGYRIIAGPQAVSLRNQLEAERGSSSTSHILHGQVASQGYAQGPARVILALADFDKFHDGDVLVTGMTRPEFLPLMKRALAIVTNEGGITCHAAIVSRELNIPCIIGTKNATDAIQDGDMVEVRATHGTVRIVRSDIK